MCLLIGVEMGSEGQKAPQGLVPALTYHGVPLLLEQLLENNTGYCDGSQSYQCRCRLLKISLHLCWNRRTRMRLHASHRGAASAFFDSLFCLLTAAKISIRMNRSFLQSTCSESEHVRREWWQLIYLTETLLNWKKCANYKTLLIVPEWSCSVG